MLFVSGAPTKLLTWEHPQISLQVSNVGIALSKVQGPDHHGCRTQGVTGPFEVVPLYPIQFSMILSRSVEHSI